MGRLLPLAFALGHEFINPVRSQEIRLSAVRVGSANQLELIGGDVGGDVTGSRIFEPAIRIARTVPRVGAQPGPPGGEFDSPYVLTVATIPTVSNDNDSDLEQETVDGLSGQVRDITVSGLPQGYDYKATRYADVILKEAFPNRFADLQSALDSFRPTLDELRSGGGGRTVFVKRFDESLANRLEDERTIWGKQNITIEKGIGFDGAVTPVSKVRGHEIDMFGLGSVAQPLPGVAVEMEWNNKDPFFDRDLINFQALHHEGAIAVGVIITRGADLQNLISTVIRSKYGGFKYGTSTTHWDKLVPRVNLGGGGECPLLLIGIRPDRIDGIDLAHVVREKLNDADLLRETWRDTYKSWNEAKPVFDKLRNDALELLPPVSNI